LTFGARCGSGWRSRTSARFSEREDRRPGESSRPFTERFRGPPELQRSFQSLRDIFSDRSRRFPINKGEGRGAGSELFSDFFFFASLGGGEGGGGTPKPEARVARFLVGMFRNRIFWGGETEKVSPKVLLDQSIDEKVSPNFYIFKLTEVKKCHQM